MRSYEIIDHTADIAMRISSDSRSELFFAAFDGLKSISKIDEAKRIGDEFRETFKIEGIDDEDLIARFLNEMLIQIQDLERAPIEIKELHFENSTIDLTVSFRKIEEFPDDYAEIKAATYHMLKIENRHGILSATIIFDV